MTVSSRPGWGPQRPQFPSTRIQTDLLLTWEKSEQGHCLGHQWPILEFHYKSWPLCFQCSSLMMYWESSWWQFGHLVPSTHVGDPNRAPGSQLQCGPAPDVVATWERTNEWKRCVFVCAWVSERERLRLYISQTNKSFFTMREIIIEARAWNWSMTSSENHCPRTWRMTQEFHKQLWKM